MPPRSKRRILRLRAAIVGIEPEIWRTIDIDDSLTLAQLHVVLQAAFGWTNSHLHRFSDDDPWAVHHGIPRIGRRPRAWVDAWSLEEDDSQGEENEAQTTVREAFEHDRPLWYTYDLGDTWVHQIDLIDRDAAVSDEPLAQIVIGERRAPFEDSGGTTGYAELAGVLADATHPEHRHSRLWAEGAAGMWGSIDLEDPDLDGARAELATLLGLPAFTASDPWNAADPRLGLPIASPIAHLAEDLPVDVRWNLVRHLGRTGLLKGTPGPDDGADMVAPYAWLLGRIGAEGMTLTKAGWMPPAAVLEGMTALGWREWWIGEANREDQTFPMRDLRDSATRLRLIRKVKGRLEIGARARKLIGDGAALSDEIARMLLRQRMTDGQRIASTFLILGIADGSISTRRDAERTVLGALNDIGFAAQDGSPLDRRWCGALVEPVLDVLLTLGLWRGKGYIRETPPTAALRTLACRALL